MMRAVGATHKAVASVEMAVGAPLAANDDEIVLVERAVAHVAPLLQVDHSLAVLAAVDGVVQDYMRTMSSCVCVSLSEFAI